MSDRSTSSLSPPATTPSRGSDPDSPHDQEVEKGLKEAASTPKASKLRALSEESDPDTPTPLAKKSKIEVKEQKSSSNPPKSIEKVKEKSKSTAKKAQKESEDEPTSTPKQAKTDSEEENTPARKKVKNNASAPRKSLPLTRVPRSPAEMSKADKMLVREKEAGTSWSEIRTKWIAITGQAVGKSTLPNRYARIKTYRFTFTAAQDKLLLETKDKVEREFEISKWGLISEALSEGEVKFTDAMVQKRYKELSKIVKEGAGEEEIEDDEDDDE